MEQLLAVQELGRQGEQNHILTMFQALFWMLPVRVLDLGTLIFEAK